MKLKEIFYGIGLKPGVKEYTFDLDAFMLPNEGEIQYARWRHPKQQRDQFTQGMVDALRRFLREGDVAIDIGAHGGDTALPMALAVGPAGTVFALEPNPHAFKILLANSALNRKRTNIVPLMFAATPQDGSFEFEYSDSGFCNGGLHEGINRWRHTHFFKLPVAGKNLVKFLKAEYPDQIKKIRYVKIDTEGSDRTVASSIRELLQQARPYIRSEIYEHTNADYRRAYHQELTALGYRIHKLTSQEDYFGPELTPDDMMKWRHYDIFAVPR
jgi:FkbM family methyltransferase